MKITSPVLQKGENVPYKYTCIGKNINLPLIFHDIPKQTKSLILIFEDRDAKPIPWVHWLVFNIPKKTTHVDEGQLPEGGVEGLANNKSFGYEGPCPKYFKGVHHYYFTLIALSETLKIPKKSDKNKVLKAAQQHTLDTAELMVKQKGTMR